MADEKNFPEEIGEDEFENDDVITLTSGDGEEIDFIEIAGIAHQGEFYAILQPVELLEGMADDEALVFHVTRNEETGDDKFEIVIDDEIIDIVFQKYNELLDNAQSGGEDEE